MRTSILVVVLALLAIAGPLDGAHRKPSAPLGPAGASDTKASPAVDTRVEDAELARAKQVLAELKRTYVHLEGVTVRIADTPQDEQAIAYYTTGEILIDPDHSVSIEEILAHEIWHVIDWRDDGRLDWGEDLPPSDPREYLR